MKKFRILVLLLCIGLLSGCGKKDQKSVTETKDNQQGSYSLNVDSVELEEDGYTVTVTIPKDSIDSKTGAYDSVFWTTKENIRLSTSILNQSLYDYSKLNFKEEIVVNNRLFDIYCSEDKELEHYYLHAFTILGRNNENPEILNIMDIMFTSIEEMNYEDYLRVAKENLEYFEFSDNCYNQQIVETDKNTAFLVSDYNTGCIVEYTPGIEDYTNETYFAQKVAMSTGDEIVSTVYSGFPSHYWNYIDINKKSDSLTPIYNDSDEKAERVEIGNNTYYYFSGELSNGVRIFEYNLKIDIQDRYSEEPDIITGNVIFEIPSNATVTDTELKEYMDNYVKGITWFTDERTEDGMQLEIFTGGKTVDELLEEYEVNKLAKENEPVVEENIIENTENTISLLDFIETYIQPNLTEDDAIGIYEDKNCIKVCVSLYEENSTGFHEYGNVTYDIYKNNELAEPFGSSELEMENGAHVSWYPSDDIIYIEVDRTNVSCFRDIYCYSDYDEAIEMMNTLETNPSNFKLEKIMEDMTKLDKFVAPNITDEVKEKYRVKEN